MSNNVRQKEERRKSGGMFRKWFSTPTKPVMPGGDTYGEPRSAKPTLPAPSQMKSQEELRQASLTSSLSKSSTDTPLKRPNTAKEYSNPTKSFAKVDSEDNRMPKPAAARPSIESRPSIQSRSSNHYTPTMRRQDPPPANTNYLSRTSTLRSSQVDGADDSMSDTQPVAFNELEDLKSRIRNLELTRRQSSHRPSQVESISERPSTASTIMSISRPRNVPTSSLNEMRSPGYFSKSQSLLQSALRKAEHRVSGDVFQALEAAAQDAMDLSTLSASANTATYSSSYAPDNSLTDRRFRRTADNLCRSLTELCIALCEDGTPTDMRSESRMSMRKASRESLYQQSQSGMSNTYSRSSTRHGSVLAARNARTADPTYDDGQSLASRQASHRNNGSQSTITDNRFTDNGFRFDNDDEIRRPGSVSRTTSSGLTNSDRTRSLTLNPKYSNVSLRAGDRRIDDHGAFSMHALTSDRAETHSPLSERFGRDQRYLQPQTQPSSQQYLGNPHNNIDHNNNDVYELPTQAPSPNNEKIPHHHQQTHNHHNNNITNYPNTSNTSYNRTTTIPLSPSTHHTPTHDLSSSSSAYPFPSSTTTPSSSHSAAIPIPPRTTPTSPGAGSYSSTLTQRIMERRMQQARESQTALSSASAYGSSLPSGRIGGVGSLLNGLPSASGGMNANNAGGGINGVGGTGSNSGLGGMTTQNANTSTTRLSSMSNRSAPRVGLLKPKGYREGNSGFGGGVTG